MNTIGTITKKLGVIVGALAATALIGSPANALGNNAPNATVGGYGVNVGASVFCDAATHQMTVSESASAMQGLGPFGPVASQYDAGQWIRFNVWARETSASSWTQIYSWSPWRYYNTLTSTMYVERLVIPAALGTNVVTGAKGHNYQVLVQIDWWTGKDNIVNVTPEYTQVYRTSPYTSYYLNPSRCVF